MLKREIIIKTSEMAQGKKSFIAYSDWKDVFDELPNEDAGALIKHIFAYVNDENPVSDSVLIRAVFANIKSTLKRDLSKWDNQLQQRVSAGKRSAELRAQNKSNENPTVVDPRKRKSTDSVNDSVSDTVNVTVNDTNTHIPTLTQFLEYGQTLCLKSNKPYKDMIFVLEQKFQAWLEAGWKDGHGKKIKNWKTKLGNTISYLKPISNQQHGQTSRESHQRAHDELEKYKFPQGDGQ